MTAQRLRAAHRRISVRYIRPSNVQALRRDACSVAYVRFTVSTSCSTSYRITAMTKHDRSGRRRRSAASREALGPSSSPKRAASRLRSVDAARAGLRRRSRRRHDAYSSISSGTERLLFTEAARVSRMLALSAGPRLRSRRHASSAVGAASPTSHVGDEVFVGGSMCYTDVAAAFGGQSSRLIKRAAQVVPLHGIPLAQAPLLALAATSLHGVRRLGDVNGQRVADPRHGRRRATRGGIPQAGRGARRRRRSLRPTPRGRRRSREDRRSTFRSKRP